MTDFNLGSVVNIGQLFTSSLDNKGQFFYFQQTFLLSKANIQNYTNNVFAILIATYPC